MQTIWRSVGGPESWSPLLLWWRTTGLSLLMHLRSSITMQCSQDSGSHFYCPSLLGLHHKSRQILLLVKLQWRFIMSESLRGFNVESLQRELKCFYCVRWKRRGVVPRFCCSGLLLITIIGPQIKKGPIYWSVPPLPMRRYFLLEPKP